ncbi:TPA: hypothetical protein ACKP1B_004267 [Serratia fonticola]
MKKRMTGLCISLFDLLLGYFVVLSAASTILSFFLFKHDTRNLIYFNVMMITLGLLSWSLQRKLKAYRERLIKEGIIPPKKVNHRPY